ncbi:hypothetical protein GDO86_019255 [Hymenochirus boettgeri]|uniref:Sulfotransferase n=1 Tax=Hymenochirus boettgeri TaxID=247094 RepID=A0A8T2IKY3_9PIPI|nr:hypothetical protein GDO86_019255 [Hymenochirus boettgeri]
MDVVQRWRCKDWDEVRGVPLPRAFTSNWKRIDFFQARDDDIYIITYPKSGTTWMSEIIDVVLSDGDIERSKRDSIYNKVPMLEFDAPGLIPPGSQQLESVPSPRVIKTHLPISLIPKSIWEKNCKIVYMARNPKDIAVSYYYFDKMTNLNPDPGPWDHFLERFIQGKGEATLHIA